MQKPTKQSGSVPQPEYEYLKAQATVHNQTNWLMKLTGSNLSWGKWITSPVDVSAGTNGFFAAQGRASSPSGTEGWATWTLEDHPQRPTIRVTFDTPAVGRDSASITCQPNVVAVRVTQTRGNDNHIDYYIG